MSEALKKELIFYGSYHNDAVNKLIHAVCVPVLLWTGMAMLAPIQIATFSNFTLTPAHVGTLIYALYYIYLHFTVGCIALPILLAMDYSAHNYWNWDWENKMLILLAIHVFSWILQFVGHGKFEGRKPALLDSLTQAVLTAPFFVLFEYLFFFGFFHDLHQELQREIFLEVNRKRL